jgi:16S rRNA (guanine1207-N2)-methyltransferase
MIRTKIDGLELTFETSPGLFSPTAVDEGTAAMLRHASITSDDKVLDLGCGYGVVGVYAARLADPSQVWLVDVDPLAVEFAQRNLRLNRVEGATVVRSDGFNALTETGFTKILCNPPYHVDFSVPKHLIEKGFNRLSIGGTMLLVTKRDRWYRNKLRAIFGGVRVYREASYFVFEAKKLSPHYANSTRRPRRIKPISRRSGSTRRLTWPEPARCLPPTGRFSRRLTKNRIPGVGRPTGEPEASALVVFDRQPGALLDGDVTLLELDGPTLASLIV